MTLRQAFDTIYRENRWAGQETRSGPGSGTAATIRIREAIASLVAELGIQSVVDAACGEGFWQPDLPGYLGLDVSRTAITAARLRNPGRAYRVHDVRRSCPRADLVICRDAMQHLPLADGAAILDAIRQSGSSWLLASTFVRGANVEVAPGGAYSPDLEAPPFNLPCPERLISDGWDYETGDQVRDPRKALGLWRLR